MADEDKKVVLPSNADSAIRPSDVTRLEPAVGAPVSAEARKLKTIKLKPLKPVAPAQDISQEETVSIGRGAPEDNGTSAEDDATVGIDKMAKKPVVQEEVPPAASGTEDEDATVKIQKSQKQQAAQTAPPIPGVKQTIKLRPSSASGEASATQTAASATPMVAKPTMKLTPTKTGIAPETAAAQAQEAPPADDGQKKAIKLVAKKPSAPTVQLAPSEQEEQAPTATATQVPKRTLKIKTQGGPPPPPSASRGEVGMSTEHGAPPMAEPPQGSPLEYQQMSGQKPAEETSALVAVAASIALIALGYFAYMLFDQYKSLFM